MLQGIAMLVNNMLADFIWARHNVALGKNLEEAYARIPELRVYHFTNVDRMMDTGTKYMMEAVPRYFENPLLGAAIYRMFGLTGCLDILGDRRVTTKDDALQAVALLRTNKPAFTSAYLTTAWSKKVEQIVTYMMDGVEMRYRDTVAATISYLQLVDGIGPFLAAQIALDGVALGVVNDPEGCPTPGPGARAGLKLFGYESIQECTEALRANGELASLLWITPAIAEHSLCEAYKLDRIRAGGFGRKRRKH